MTDPIRIIQIGADPVLAEVLAEQAPARFEWKVVAQLSEADPSEYLGADVWVLAGQTPSPQATESAPLCIRICAQDDDEGSEEVVFKKPFRLAQFLDVALGSASLRRKKQPRVLKAGIEFQPFARKVIEAATGREIILTDKEASLLCAVLDAGETGLQRKDAMTQLWGFHPDVDSHAVDTTLYRLRQKLQEMGECDTVLVNEGGVYRWKAIAN